MAGEAAASVETERSPLGNGAGTGGDDRTDASPAELPEHVADTGDRLVDLRRPDRWGRPFSLYEHHIGRPVALLVLTGDEVLDRSAVAAVVDLARNGELTADRPPDGDPDGGAADGGAAGDDPGAHPPAPAVVVVAPPGADAGAAATALGRVPTLADDGAVARLLGAGPGVGPRLVVTDAARRVVANLPAVAGVAEVARRRLGAWSAQLGGPGPGPLRTTCVPALVVPHVLDPRLCAELIDHRDAAGDELSLVHRLIDGRVQLVADPTIKVRRDHTVIEPLITHELARLLHRRLVPEMARTFGYVPGRFERFKLVRYDAGGPPTDGADEGVNRAAAGRFATHRDNVTADAAHRRFALTLVLGEDYEGGELCFPEYGPDRYRPPAGAAFVFPCSIAHEVRPVTAGTRHVLITFFADAPVSPRASPPPSRRRRGAG